MVRWFKTGAGRVSKVFNHLTTQPPNHLNARAHRMELTLLPPDGELIRVACAGQIQQYLIPSAPHPLEKVLGPDCFNRRILLNLERTTFIDTSGIAWLLSCHKRCLQNGGRLVIHSAPPLIDQTLRVLRMDMVLQMAADEPEARALALRDAKA